DLDLVTVVDLPHHVRADVVEQRDLRGDNALGPTVRIATGDRRAGVDDSGNAARNEPLGGDPVDVLVIDDRDVAAADPLREIFRTEADPRGATHGLRRGVPVARVPAPHARTFDFVSNSFACRRACADESSPASM